MNPILELLNSDNFRTYNIHIARKLGSVNAAIMLAEFIQRYKYHFEKNELIMTQKESGKWFYYTHEKAEERTALSRDEQDTGIKKLEKAGLIKKIIIGVPGKRHFQINEEMIIELITDSKKDSRMRESHNVQCGKPTNSIPNKEHQEDPHITTNYPEDPDIVDVSSFSIKKLEELESLAALEETQKKTLYKKFTHEQIKPQLAGDETIQVTAFLFNKSLAGMVLFGALSMLGSGYFFAAATNRRLFLIKTRMGFFALKAENQGIMQIPYDDIVAIEPGGFLNQRSMTLSTKDGSRISFRLNTLARFLSGQRQFLARLPQLVEQWRAARS